jgi:hypothetical protein
MRSRERLYVVRQAGKKKATPELLIGSDLPKMIAIERSG